MTTRRYTNWICRAETGDDGTTKVIASTPAEDRYNDVVAPDWNLERYAANSIVAWNHDYGLPPIGRATSVELEGDRLVATIRWDDDPQHNPLGATVAHQFREGFLSSVSVGFAPGKSTPRKKLPEDHPAHAARGTFFEQNELLEVSAVGIPANPEAVAIRARSWGLEPATMTEPDETTEAPPAPSPTIEQRHILQVVEEEDGTVWIQYASEAEETEEEEPEEEEATTEEEEAAYGEEEEEEERGQLRFFDAIAPAPNGWDLLFTP